MTGTLITVAATGAEADKVQVPALPVTLEELTKTAVRCQQAGAAVVHVHMAPVSSVQSWLRVPPSRTTFSHRTVCPFVYVTTSVASTPKVPDHQCELLVRVGVPHVYVYENVVEPLQFVRWHFVPASAALGSAVHVIWPAPPQAEGAMDVKSYTNVPDAVVGLPNVPCNVYEPSSVSL